MTDTPSARRLMAQAAAAAVSQALFPRNNAPSSLGAPAYRQQQPQQQQYYYDTYYQPPPPPLFGLIPFFVGILQWLIQLGLLATLSMASYLVLYHFVMPTRVAVEPLYFDYSGARPPAFNAWSKKQQQENHKRHGQHETALEPWAAVDLFARPPWWDAAFPDCVPDPLTHHRLLQRQQSYYIDVSLQLPETLLNRQAGMFSITTELHSHNFAPRNNGTVLARSRRSTRFPHSSAWISVVQKMTLLAPLLLGALEESRSVTLSVFRHFVELEQQPLQYVLIRIVAPPTGANQTVPEVLGGELVIGEELNEYQEILKEWFYGCACMGSLVFAGLYVLLWKLLSAVWSYVRQRYTRPEEQEPPCELDMDDLSHDPVFEDFPFFDHEHGEKNRAEQPEPASSERCSPQEPSAGEADDDDSGNWDEWEDLFFEADEAPSPDSPYS